MSNKRILVIGELNIDLIFNQIQGFPVIGEEILAEDLNLTLGSSSAIFACNIATLGINTSFCGMLGKDSFGKFILTEFSKKGVNTDAVIESDREKTGMTLVLNYSEDRANITYCGAMERMTIKDVPFSTFYQFHHLHFSSFFLQKGIQKDIPYVFKKAKEVGLTTSLDLQWDPANEWNFPLADCLPYVDVFFLNKAEILSLSGKNTLDEAMIDIGKHAKLIVVKLGREGSVAYEDQQAIFSKPFLHQHFVDAIGAGDSFNAGFIANYLKDASLTESMEFANLCGSISTTSFGGTSAFEDMQAFNRKAKELFNIQNSK